MADIYSCKDRFLYHIHMPVNLQVISPDWSFSLTLLWCTTIKEKRELKCK